MSMAKWLLTASCATALGVLHSWPLLLAADKPVLPDVSKYKAVVNPTARLVAGSAPGGATTGMVDFSKALRVEPAVKSLVASTAPSTLTAPTVAPTAANGANPSVEPGKVRWHRSLADAQVAAQKSGKPVLLFHMMGQLDKQFC
jgi:hypothetical protein